MSIFRNLRNLDRLRKTATRAVEQHGDKISRGIDRAAKTVDERTGHKHSDKINKGVSKAKEGLERLDQQNPGGRGGGTPPPGSPPQSGPKQPPGTGSTPPSA